MKTIIIRNLSKTFKIGVKKKQTTLAKIISSISNREAKREIMVLNKISFDVKEGEIIGIIGKNGSGKSTLLRIIGGIIEKDNGLIKTKGKIIPLINLDTGMQERLTVKENIKLCCHFFGLDKKEIRKKFGSIIKFAELEKFVDTKWYQLSNGMKQRIVFSIAIYSDPKILLLDEIFAVGDEQFQKKCLKEMKKLKEKGITILFASHQLSKVAKICNKVIWIDKGKIVMSGNSLKVVLAYSKNEKR